MNKGRLFFLASTLFVAGALLAASAAVTAQTYPVRPIRMIVPFAPGGPTDLTARVIAPKLGERLGQTVVVDNRPGASGMLGTEMVVRSAPDGYTLLLCSSGSLIGGPIFNPKPSYDGRRDLAPLSLVISVPYLLLVRPESGWTSAKELIAAARASPGSIKYGSSGFGAGAHLSAALLGMVAGIDIVHVPYKGSGPAAIDLMGGHLQFISELVNSSISHVKSGRLRALTVSASKRIAVLPDLPTVGEAGVPGAELEVWHGICAPAATPKPLIDRLGHELVAAANATEVRERYLASGATVVASTPKAFATAIAREYPIVEKIARTVAEKTR